MGLFDWLWGDTVTGVTELMVMSAVALIVGVVLILVGLFIAYRRVYGRYGTVLSLGMMALGALIALGVL
jgi:low temperature requirement protein LtrA